MTDDRLTELEIALAHAERTAEELSAVVREQADRVALLERRVAVLAARLGAIEEGRGYTARGRPATAALVAAGVNEGRCGGMHNSCTFHAHSMHHPRR